MKVNFAVPCHGRTEDSAFELRFAHNFRIVITGFDNHKTTIRKGEVQMAIGIKRRGMDLIVVDFFCEEFLAGFHVYANKHTGFTYLINAAIGQRGATRKHRVLQSPLFPRLAVGDFRVFVF